VERESLNTQRH